MFEETYFRKTTPKFWNNSVFYFEFGNKNIFDYRIIRNVFKEVDK